MKKLVMISLSIVAMAGFVGCGGDDPAQKNELNIGGDKTELVNAYFVDWSGTPRRTDGLVSGYYVEAFITDGELEFDGDGYATGCSGCTRSLQFDLYVDGSEFEVGSFNVWDVCDGQGDLNGAFIDIVDSSDSDMASSFSGTLKISGEEPNFTVSLNAQFSDWDNCSDNEGDGCDGCPLVDVRAFFKGEFTELEPWQVAD